MSKYPYGFERMLMGFYDRTTGAFIGKAPTLAAGTGSGAYLCKNVKSAGIAPVASSELQIQGGDRIRVVVPFRQTKLATFEVTVSDFDTDLINLIMGGNKNTTNTYIGKSHTNPNSIRPRGMWVALQNPEVDEEGNPYYRTLIISKALCTFQTGAYAFRDVSDAKIIISPLMTTKAYTGQGFGTGSNNLAFAATENLLDHYYLESENPLAFHAFKRADTDTDTYTSDYLPTSATVHATVTPNEWVAAGIPTALTSHSISTGAAVIPTGGAIGDICVETYETNYAPAA